MRVVPILVMLLIVSVVWADCGSYDNGNSGNSNRTAMANGNTGSNANSTGRVESAKPSPSVGNRAATPQPSRRVLPGRELGNDAPPVRNDNDREQRSNNLKSSTRSPR